VVKLSLRISLLVRIRIAEKGVNNFSSWYDIFCSYLFNMNRAVGFSSNRKSAFSVLVAAKLKPALKKKPREKRVNRRAKILILLPFLPFFYSR
jgi:hypothetical protein